ncbi:hypothetical protein ACFY12_13060 [Streptomyces sp. NPDC001339]|uniref:hypothetical protein n=1 Tax=Streptomyces sp. NPDC001339 TaxID=3364563 RepID=UPI0036C84310
MHSNKNSIRRGAARLAGITLGTTLCASVFLCAQAQAADGPAGVPDYQGARQVLRSAQVHDTINRFLNATDSAGKSGADGGQQDAAPMDAGSGENAQDFSLKDPVALYEVTPEFISGKAKPAPDGAVRLSYLASEVAGANGQSATALLAGRTPAPGGGETSASAGGKTSASEGQKWHLAGVRDGTTDIGFAKRATSDSTVFSEPQIHAWYQLKNGTVQPLNKEAVSGLGGKQTMSLAAYQHLVHGRYADKLPGSTYDRKGLAGAYGPAAPPAQNTPAHNTLAQNTTAQGTSPSVPMLLGGSAGLALVLAGGAYGVRARRKRSHSQVS